MQGADGPQARTAMTVQESVKQCLWKYADFSGRATRANFGGGRCLFEGSTDEATVLVLAYLSDDGLAIHITYSFPAGLADAGRELAYYSFGTSLVN